MTENKIIHEQKWFGRDTIFHLCNENDMRNRCTVCSVAYTLLGYWSGWTSHRKHQDDFFKIVFKILWQKEYMRDLCLMLFCISSNSEWIFLFQGHYCPVLVRPQMISSSLFKASTTKPEATALVVKRLQASYFMATYNSWMSRQF